MEDTFVFYRSWIESVSDLNDEQQLAFLKGVISYCLDGIEPEDPVAKFGLNLIRPMIDKSLAKRTARQEAGRRGGSVKASESKAEANGKQTEANSKQTQANESKAEANGKQTEPIINNCKLLSNKKDIPKGISKKTAVESNAGTHVSEYPYDEVIAYLNEKTGKTFQHQSKNTRSHIRGRFEEGYTLEDFKRVIDNKVAEWKDDPKMSTFLRPNTLFAVSHFEEYLNQKVVKPKNNNQFNNFHQRDYDFDSLDAQLFEQQFGGGT